MSPVLVVFEGVDASGKSTQARRLADVRRALFTFEPGDTELGVDLRRWVLDPRTPMSASTEAFVMLADRSHHVERVIAPALAAGRSVVCDRFVGSTLAYQGYGRGVDLAALEVASDLAIGPCRPDVTVLLDVDVAVVNERRAGERRDRFEAEGAAFFTRVRDGYRELARRHDWVVLDGAASVEDVVRAVDDRVAELDW